MCVPGLQRITQNKIKQTSHQTHSNQSNSLAIEQHHTQLFESLLMPERNENKPINYYIEKKSTVKTESALGKQQARET